MSNFLVNLVKRGSGLPIAPGAPRHTEASPRLPDLPVDSLVSARKLPPEGTMVADPGAVTQTPAAFPRSAPMAAPPTATARPLREAPGDPDRAHDPNGAPARPAPEDTARDATDHHATVLPRVEARSGGHKVHPYTDPEIGLDHTRFSRPAPASDLPAESRAGASKGELPPAVQPVNRVEGAPEAMTAPPDSPPRVAPRPAEPARDPALLAASPVPPIQADPAVPAPEVPTHPVTAAPEIETPTDASPTTSDQEPLVAAHPAMPAAMGEWPALEPKAAAEEPGIEVRIGRIEVRQAPRSAPSPAPRRQPRGFGGQTLARRHLDRRWY